jgi:GT2 family glycosyltransferase
VLQRSQTELTAGIVKILVVVVLYKLEPRESVTLNTLHASLSSTNLRQADIKVLLYDNTPGGQEPGELPAYVQYRADIHNGGLAKAYNYALEMAHGDGFEWLLTLDQDTDLPIDFMCKLCHTAAFVAPLQSVAAIVPSASCDGRVISPKVILKLGTLGKCFPNEFIGVSLKRAHAVNSASTIKVSALKAVGGYDPRFNLWFSDIVMYNRLHDHNFHIFVAGNIHVEHEMSGFDLKTRSTPQRYEDILRAEEAFYDEYMGTVGAIVLLLKLLFRLVYRLGRTGGGLPHFKIAFRFLCRRLFYSRTQRMESWKQAVQQRENS